jgi:fermentation-respiration switch protein FrsA (DUF1100 family)
MISLLKIVLLRDSVFWCKTRARKVSRVLLFAGYVYVGVFLALLALEDRLLFPGATFALSGTEPPAYLGARPLRLSSSCGDTIHAWFSAPPGWEPRHGAVLDSHGNGSNLTPLAGRGWRWRQALRRAVLLYDYPGYGKSTGRPSEAGCYAAGEAAYRWLVEECKVPEGEVILVGESMGEAIATELATRHPARLLVLQGAFTSMPDMAQHRFPMYPARFVVHARMDNEAKIGHVLCPVFITHGTADRVVPFRQGERLFEAAREPKRFWPVEGGKHAPPGAREFFAAVKAFLDEPRTE